MAVTHQISESVRRSVQSGCCQYITNHVYMDNGALISYNNDAMTAEDTNIRSILLVSFPENPLIPPRRVMEALLFVAIVISFVQALRLQYMHWPSLAHWATRD